MSQSHKGSRLLLKNQLIPVDFSSAHFNYSLDTYGIQYGDMVSDNGGQVYTIEPFEGQFAGAVCIDQGTTNLHTVQTPNIYNNFGTNLVTSLTTLTGETLYGQPIWRTTYQAISSNSLSSVQVDHSSHGIYLGIPTLTSGNTFMSSIYWRAFKPDVVVGGTASNIGGWSDVRTDKFSNGWNRTQTQWFGTSNKTDSKYWSFWSPSAVLNEVITIDWSCPQMEMRPWATAFTAPNTTRAMGKLWYPINTFNQNSFSISFWFKAPYIHQSALPYYGVSNGGIQTSWWNPLIEFVPTSNRNLTGLSFLIGPVGSPWNTRLTIYNNGGNSVYGNTSIQSAVWYHCVITYDGTNYKMYLNGNLDLTFASGATTIYSDSVMMVGGGYMGAPNILIDDLVMSKTAISAEEAYAYYISNAPMYNPYDYRGYAF